MAEVEVVERVNPQLMAAHSYDPESRWLDTSVHPRDLAAQLRAAGDLDGAERALRRWTRLEPASPAPLRDICAVYEAASRWEDLLAAARRWQELEAGDWRSSAWIARASFALERWGQAVQSYRIWVHHTTNDPNPWKWMWTAAARGEDQGAELEAATGWIASAPDSSDAWAAYSNALYNAGRYESALEGVTRSLALDSSSSFALNLYADILYRLERWQDALGAYRHVADQAPGEAAPWWKMWFASTRCGDRAAGLEAAAGWSSAAPTDKAAFAAYAAELFMAGNYEQQIEVTEQAMSVNPDRTINTCCVTMEWPSP